MQNEPQLSAEHIDVICSMRHGAADDKQFRATVEHNIATALEEQKEKILSEVEGWLDENVQPLDLVEDDLRAKLAEMKEGKL